jgi:hypothetical protein
MKKRVFFSFFQFSISFLKNGQSDYVQKKIMDLRIEKNKIFYQNNKDKNETMNGLKTEKHQNPSLK